MTRRALPLLQLLLLLTSQVAAQTPLLYHWGPNQGLVQYTVSSIAQDRHGYLWLGSESGASRFNGRLFETFDDDSGFTNVAVRDIVASAAGVFLLSEDGSMYVVAGSHVERVATELRVLGLVPAPGGGEPWLLSDRGLHRGVGAPPEPLPFDPALLIEHRAPATTAGGVAFIGVGAELYALAAAPSLVATAPAHIEGLFAAPGGGLGVVTRRQLLVAAPERGELRSVWATTELELSCGAAGGARTVLGSTSGALVFLTPGEPPEVVAHGLPRRAVMAVAVDREDNVWVGLDSGGVLLLPKASFVSYTQADGVGSGDAFYVVADALRGGVWVGTRNGGAAYIDDHGVKPFGEAQGLVSDRVRALHQGRDGTVYLGTAAGIQALAPDGSMWRYLAPPESFFQFFFEDADGAVYSGSRSGRLVVARGDRRFTVVAESPAAEALNFTCLARHRGALYLGTNRGLLELGAAGELSGPLFGEAGVREMVEDGDGALWVATRDRGAWRRSDGTWQQFGPAEGFDAQVRFVVTDHRGRPWFGGQRGVWSFPDAAASRLDSSRGLRSDNVFLVRFDPQGQLWIGHNLGLDLVRDGRVEAHFDHRDGLADNELNANGFAIDGQGRLWFCTMRGVSRIAAGTPARTGVAPLIHLRALEVNEQAQALPRGADRELRLAHHQSTLRFHFSGQSFVDPLAVRYTYHLDGYDEDWSRPTEVASATYRKLPPGGYTFRVRCSSVDGLESPEASLAVEIVPALWQRLWFRLCVLVLALGASFGGLLLRGWRAERRNRELERLVEQRTRDLAAANGELKRLAITDPLTGLYNRRFFEEEIAAELAATVRAFRNATDRPERAGVNVFLAVMMIDLDHFKRVNDTYGHETGDEVLCTFGRLVAGAIRSSDTLFRWGGEEFLLLARNTDPASSELLAERIRSAVADHRYSHHGAEFSVTCSIGYAPFPFLPAAPGAFGWTQLVHLADQALYLAKRSGRNAYIGVMPAPASAEPELQAVVEDLAAAAAAGRVQLESNVAVALGAD